MGVEAPQQLSLQERIKVLQDKVAARNFNYPDLIKEGLALAAEKMDALLPSPINQKKLKELWQSEKTREAYFQGFNGGKKVNTESSQRRSEVERIAVLINGFFEVDLTDQGFARALILDADHLKKHSWISLRESIERAVKSDEIKAMVYLDLLANQAANELKKTVKEMLFKNSKVDPLMMPDHQTGDYWYDKFWLDKLTTVQFALGYYNRAIAMISQKAEEIYGEDSQRALDLWRATIYLETTSCKIPNVIKAKSPIFTALTEGNIDKAELLLWKLYCKYPRAFHPKTQERLGFNEEKRIRYLSEAAAEREMARKDRERAKVIEEQNRKDELCSPENLARALSYKGVVFTGMETIITHDGEEIEEQRWFVVTDKATGVISTHIYLDGDRLVTEEKRYPAVKFTTYAMIGGKLHYLAHSRMFPGNVLKRIESDKWQTTGLWKEDLMPNSNLLTSEVREVRGKVMQQSKTI